MKKLFVILPSLALALLLTAGCGSMGNLGNSLGLGGSRTYTFNSLPQNLEQLQALPEADLSDPRAVAALTLAALTRYGSNTGDCIKMLNWLKGPEPLSGYDVQFLRDRLKGSEYIPFSYFHGATPNNNYTPNRPYKVTVDTNQYSYQVDGEGHEWCSVWVTSGGADNPRNIKLRKKGSTGQWFLNDILCLGQIRTPANQDKWY